PSPPSAAESTRGTYTNPGRGEPCAVRRDASLRAAVGARGICAYQARAPSMSKASTVSEWALPWDDPTATATPEEPALVLVWSLEGPERWGQTARVVRKAVRGRDEVADALLFRRERPTGDAGGAPLVDSRVSRRQLVVEPLGDGRIRVENVGKCPLFV